MPPRRVVKVRPARHNIEEQGVGQKRGARQEEADTSRIREILRMNPPSFTGSSTFEDPKNFIEELQKIFDVMHVADTERMVTDMRSRMSLFVGGLSRLSSKEGREAMQIGNMDISRLMVYVQQVKEEKLRDREEFRNKKATTGNEFGQHKSNVNLSFFQQKQKGLAPSSASAPAP
ncbi:uncharacterized protein LOC125840757 [Solanum verrucosum]|uniref:uncharacterized protein LOC125840757 n=1 Tax=Solanum verrucosum TaxID=315347 RepID=UPI0020D15ACB|nr:uncharacterized protein LOC125840757 [Solanum verrucosum]